MCVHQSAWNLRPTRHFFDKFITSASKLPRSFLSGNPSKKPVKCQYKFLTGLIFLFSSSSCYLLTSERDEDNPFKYSNNFYFVFVNEPRFDPPPSPPVQCCSRVLKLTTDLQHCLGRWGGGEGAQVVIKLVKDFQWQWTLHFLTSHWNVTQVSQDLMAMIVVIKDDNVTVGLVSAIIYCAS